jgi:hypothetical protein
MNLCRKGTIVGILFAAALGLTTPASASSAHFKHAGAIALDHEGHLWVANNDYFGLTEIDASTGSVIRVINNQADGFIDPSGIAVDGGDVWVVSGGVTYANGTSHVGTVTELNAATGSLIRTVSSKRHGITGLDAISVDANNVWVMADGGSRLAELSSSTGKVERVHRGRERYAEPSGMAISDGHLWVASPEISDGVIERSAVTGNKIRTITPTKLETPPGGGIRSRTFLGPQFVAADARYVWIANEGGVAAKLFGSVTQIDATTGKVVRTIDSPADHFWGTITSIVSDGRHVWIANGTDDYRGRRHGDTVTELNASNGSLVRVIKLHNGIYSDPVGLVSNGVDVWVSDQGGGAYGIGSVIELSAATGTVVRVVR